MGAVLGLLLAAGAGRRMGKPKALLRGEDGTPFVTRSAAVLRDGGCDLVTVVLGAGSDAAEPLLDDTVRVVVAEDWASGMGASFRAGLADALTDERVPDVTAAVVTLVDLPDVDAAVVRRVVDVVGTEAKALGRATYHGRPGHPVVIGRDHWYDVAATALGDKGARDYLAERDPVLVECGDLATGVDVDRPDQV